MGGSNPLLKINWYTVQSLSFNGSTVTVRMEEGLKEFKFRSREEMEKAVSEWLDAGSQNIPDKVKRQLNSPDNPGSFFFN